MDNITPLKQTIRPQTIQPIRLDKSECNYDILADLNSIGIHINPQHICEIANNQMRFTDSMAPQIGLNNSNYISYLQQFLPGVVMTATSKLTCDELVGQTFIGDWADEIVIRPRAERSGIPAEYSDLGNTPLVNVHMDYDFRSIYRHELGAEIGLLETERAQKGNWQLYTLKRTSVIRQLDITRNAIFFFGWAGGITRTYGILNDPNLKPIIQAPSADKGGWDGKGIGFDDIQRDIRFAVKQLRTQSNGLIVPDNMAMTLAVPPGKMESLKSPTSLGMTVAELIQKNYPNMRIIPVPELEGSNPEQSSKLSGDILYLYVDRIPNEADGSTDGGETILQILQSKVRSLGVTNNIKHTLEIYTMAGAGAYIQRPYGVVRLGGI